MIGVFLKQLWDYIEKPFKVLPPDGYTGPYYATNKKYRAPEGYGTSLKYPVVGMNNTAYGGIKRSYPYKSINARKR